MSRTLAIGDIHGCDRALARLIAVLDITPPDTVVILGDVVDRGPGTRQCLDQLLELRERCHLVFLLGNHEEMMRDALSGRGLTGLWLDNGGDATVASYHNNIENVPPTHIKLLIEAASSYETDREAFVHASLEPAIPLSAQTADYLRWKHVSGSETPRADGKRVICGHTPQRDGIPLAFPGWVVLDTFAWGSGWLSALDCASDTVNQTRQTTNETRSFPLARYARDS